jgi:hypothetical protein
MMMMMMLMMMMMMMMIGGVRVFLERGAKHPGVHTAR